jgi:glutamyl-Q tRNA(Asp) synthetase
MTDSRSNRHPPTSIGRFAPSPSGPLHFGSLVCALASYLDARARTGQWLVRIEDIDPPREQPGARDAILHCLEAHQLHWDGSVLHQSARSEAYDRLLQQLTDWDLIYRCNCTRQRLQSLGGVYDGHCRRHPPAVNQPAALRLKVRDLPSRFRHVDTRVAFVDGIQGPQEDDVSTGGDFVVHRKDGLFAYQLAVVADDVYQAVTHVLRGSDLLDTTPRQHYLFRLLGQQPPAYSHIPVVTDQHQQKLSKQNHAPAVEPARAGVNLWHACRFLGLAPPGEAATAEPGDLLQWAVANWDLRRVTRSPAQTDPR